MISQYLRGFSIEAMSWRQYVYLLNPVIAERVVLYRGNTVYIDVKQ